MNPKPTCRCGSVQIHRSDCDARPERHTPPPDTRPTTTPATGQWSARCDCYKGHNSSSGRCNNRNVTDQNAKPGDAVLCERCRTECAK